MCKYKSYRLFLVGFLLTLISCFTMFSIGCSCGKAKGTVTLDFEEIQVFENETFTLNVEVTGKLDTENITWTSLDETICTVENGVVTGIKAGVTEVVVDVDGVQDTCSVTVIREDELAVINLSQKDVIVRTGKYISVTAILSFKGNEVQNTINWSSADTAVATVVDGKITGVKAGETVVTASTVYNDEHISATIKVVVKDDIVLEFGDTLINLKANSILDAGRTEYIFAPKVKFNDEEVAAEYEYSTTDDQVVSVSADGKVTANGAGNASIVVNAKITGDNAISGNTYSQSIEFAVTKSEIVLLEDINTFEVYEGIDSVGLKPNSYSLDFSSYGIELDANEVKVKLISNDIVKDAEFLLSENKDIVYVNGSSFGSDIYGEVTVEVSDRTFVATRTLGNVITKYISTEEDLANMMDYGGIDRSTTAKAYNGYFVLDRNIELAGYPVLAKREQHKDYNHNTSFDGTCGFQGVFDGQGYTISNLFAFGHFGGIFGNVGYNAIVKNLGVEGELRPTHSGDTVFSPLVMAFNFLGTLENSSIDIVVGSSSSSVEKRYFPIACNLAFAKLKEVVIRFDASDMPVDAGAAYIGGQLGQLVGTYMVLQCRIL